MSKSTNLIKKLTKMSNRIETYAGKTGVNDFKYTDKAWVSPDIPYHIMYITDGAGVERVIRTEETHGSVLWSWGCLRRKVVQ